MAVFVFPGQGSQKVGMGEGLFEAFPDQTAKADAILGYSIQELCLKDPEQLLGKTQFTQPALFVVGALTYHKKLQEGQKPSFVAGHSLGEYCALYAAGSFDFETGLRLVQKRGELMSHISGGAMAAIIGKSADEVRTILSQNGLESIDVANLNSFSQVVISGLKDDVARSKAAFDAAGARFFPLNVSGAFHSRYMTPAKVEFSAFLNQFSLNDPKIPCIANCTGKPYEMGQVKHNLAEQLNHSVLWVDSMQYLMQQGQEEFVEVGPGSVLTGLLAKIKKNQ